MNQQDDTPLYEGRFLSLRRKANGWEYCARRNDVSAVMIFALNSKDCVLLVEEFRPAIGKKCICFPAGLSGDEAPEAHETAARRELLEEAGYSTAEMRFLFSGPSSPGISSEMLHFFLALDLKKTALGGGVEGENITVHEVPIADIDSWLLRQMQTGISVDPRVYAGLYFLRNLP